MAAARQQAPWRFNLLNCEYSLMEGNVCKSLISCFRSGLEVITTCSPKNFWLVRSLGADHVFDYKSPKCAASIREVTNDQLGHVFDTISTPETAEICCNSISSQGGKYADLGGLQELPRKDVENL